MEVVTTVRLIVGEGDGGEEKTLEMVKMLEVGGYMGMALKEMNTVKTIFTENGLRW